MSCIASNQSLIGRVFALTHLFATLIGVSWCIAANAGDSGGELHVPSPDWRDQVIYFAMIDRFDDADPGNNDQGQREFDPRSNAHYSGGDLKGLIRRLDYVQQLGATALWITPPVAHRWWDAQANYGGYHGYWGEHFKRIDAHFGTLRDYRRLSRQLHRRGMFLVQDIVVNHMANWFHYGPVWNAADPAHGYVRNADADGRAAPTQSPFDRNDPRDPKQRAEAIYHWTPQIKDHRDQDQEWRYQLADLDDLNTESPQMRQALRDSYGYWIRKAGVDAFRVDTAFYVPHGYFDDFLMATDRRAPGVLRVARASGRNDFHVFGEGFGIDRPFADTQARRIDAYMRSDSGEARLPGMLNFPLYGSTLDVFARGQPTAVLAHRIANVMQVHANPHLMPSFVDNHDVERFLAAGSVAALKQALLLIMTLPGIPTIYYGTEQGFSEQRGAMFAAGFASGGRDHFDTQAPLYRYLQRLTALRRSDRLFSRGTPALLAQNAAAPGALAYRMAYGDAAAIVVFNSADTPTLLDRVDTGLAPGTVLEPVFLIDGEVKPIVVDAEGRIDRELPARSGAVWRGTAQRSTPAQRATAPTLLLRDTSPIRGDLALSGRAAANAAVQIVVDGDLASAHTVTADASGAWQANIDTASMVDATIEHQLVARSIIDGAVSARQHFRVERRWSPQINITDASGDDQGPHCRYLYPDDPVWREQHPLDLRGIRVATSGGALQLDLQMAAIATQWNPPNGFDHVAFTIFIALPDTPGGVAEMPLQHATLPSGMRWHYRLRAHGWSNALFSSSGADATHEGTSVAPTAAISVLPDAKTVRFVFPAAALGSLKSLSGAKLYINTWDYDGGYRALALEAQSMVFGGGRAGDPLWMDESTVITLP